MDLRDFSQTLTALANAPPQDLPEEVRKSIVAACDKLKEQLENPLETTARLMFGGYEGAALRLAIDLKLIDTCVSAKIPVSAQDLAEKSEADVLLVVRIMRMLSATSLFKEVGEDTYIASPRAAAYVHGSPLREAVIHLSSKLTTIGSLPEYFAANGYQNPDDAYDGPFQYAHHTKLHYFDWLPTKPHLQHAYNVTMAVQRVNRGQQWFEFYPVQEKLRLEDASQPLLVDIGGGYGHDLINFSNQFPDYQGKLILEDLPAVVEKANVPERIEIVSHDFLKPQRQEVHNARAYYLRTILHDWPDKQALIILQHIRDAMSEESILLINENVLPDRNASLYQCKLDFNMMASYSALDRTEKQFESLLNTAGFKLCKTWKPEDYVPGSGTLFEAVRA